MLDIKEVADVADLIINGYAYTKDGNNIRVLNLNNPKRALVLNADSEVIEASMDDIEIDIVLDYFHKNSKFMEV